MLGQDVGRLLPARRVEDHLQLVLSAAQFVWCDRLGLLVEEDGPSERTHLSEEYLGRRYGAIGIVYIVGLDRHHPCSEHGRQNQANDGRMPAIVPAGEVILQSFSAQLLTPIGAPLQFPPDLIHHGAVLVEVAVRAEEVQPGSYGGQGVRRYGQYGLNLLLVRLDRRQVELGVDVGYHLADVSIENGVEGSGASVQFLGPAVPDHGAVVQGYPQRRLDLALQGAELRPLLADDLPFLVRLAALGLPFLPYLA